MKSYAIHIRWRGYRWNITGLARCSADLVAGLITYFGPGAFITVKAL